MGGVELRVDADAGTARETPGTRRRRPAGRHPLAGPPVVPPPRVSGRNALGSGGAAEQDRQHGTETGEARARPPRARGGPATEGLHGDGTRGAHADSSTPAGYAGAQWTEFGEQHEPGQDDDQLELVTRQPVGHDSPQAKKVPELRPHCTEFALQQEPPHDEDQLALETWYPVGHVRPHEKNEVPQFGAQWAEFGLQHEPEHEDDQLTLVTWCVEGQVRPQLK